MSTLSQFSSNNTTDIIPVEIIAWGAGGGGGGSSTYQGGGGGGGGVLHGVYNFRKGEVLSYSIGSGGAAGAPGVGGSGGEATSFSGDYLYRYVKGGGGGGGGGSTYGGAGGDGGCGGAKAPPNTRTFQDYTSSVTTTYQRSYGGWGKSFYLTNRFGSYDIKPYGGSFVAHEPMYDTRFTRTYERYYGAHSGTTTSSATYQGSAGSVHYTLDEIQNYVSSGIYTAANMDTIGMKVPTVSLAHRTGIGYPTFNDPNSGGGGAPGGAGGSGGMLISYSVVFSYSTAFTGVQDSFTLNYKRFYFVTGSGFMVLPTNSGPISNRLINLSW
jgi:hypothetical protein